MTEKNDKYSLNKQSFPGLSPRLSAIAGMVREGSVVADVGTDHALLPVSLVRSGVCPRAAASDISCDAARRAEKNVREAGLADRISVHVRDGLNGYESGDADVLVISGMGGPLMIRILSENPDLTESFGEMILSPQSEIRQVRIWLRGNGYMLEDEAFVEDAGHGYTIMRTCRGEETLYGEDPVTRRAQEAYGPILLDNQDQNLRAYVQRETARLDEALIQVSRAASGRGARRIAELNEEKEAACRALTLLTI